MGYTHYWTSEKIGKEDWAKFTEIAGEIITEHRDILCFEYDKPDKPLVCDDKQIRFNGKGNDGYETFEITTNGGRNSCKTNRKPYDLPVVKILLAFKYVLKDRCNVSSDGYADEQWSNWQDAIGWFNEKYDAMLINKRGKIKVCKVEI